jgi:hypothetical protein
LIQRAEEIPDNASERLRDMNYHPHARSPKFRVAMGGASAVVLATATSVVLLTVGPGVQDAFASWTPTPTSPSNGQIAAAETTCLGALVTMALTGNSANDKPTFIATPSAWQAEVADVRGSFTLVAYQATDGTTTNSASCLSGGSSWSAGPQIMLSNGEGATIGGGPSSGAGPTQGQATVSTSDSAPSPGTIGGLSTNWNSSSNDDVAVGQAGSGVTDVTLILNDGTSVTTTVANGYFAAWWPGDSATASADVSTTQGTSTVTFPNS